MATTIPQILLALILNLFFTNIMEVESQKIQLGEKKR